MTVAAVPAYVHVQFVRFHGAPFRAVLVHAPVHAVRVAHAPVAPFGHVPLSLCALFLHAHGVPPPLLRGVSVRAPFLQLRVAAVLLSPDLV